MRLFVALVPPLEVLAALPTVPAGVRAVAAEQVHLTLAFLGEQQTAEPLARALDQALADCAAPWLRLAGAGRFGSAVWLGVQGDLDRLAALDSAAQQGARTAGVVLEDRPWRPHLTVGRVRDGHGRSTRGPAPAPPSLTGYGGPAARWNDVRLVRSHLGSDGARHETLARWTLSRD